MKVEYMNKQRTLLFKRIKRLWMVYLGNEDTYYYKKQDKI